MIPFDVEGGLPLAFARFLSVAGLAAAAGSLVHARFLRPAGLSDESAQRLRLLCFRSLAAAVAAALVWLVAQTWDFAGSLSPADVWGVLAHTAYGHLLSARLALLPCAALALRWRQGAAAALLGTAALLLQAGHSHAFAMGGAPLLLASSALHVLAAGLWIGALPALWITLSDPAPGVAHAAAARFSAAGIACVAVLLATAIVQFRQLVMGLPGLAGTAYGWVVCVKILLFGLLACLAARNKFSLAPALAGQAAARRGLRVSIAIETAVGLLVLAAASTLTELQPPMHLQPLWPFAERLSLDTIAEDPDFRREVLEAAAALAGAAAILAASLLMRRFRLAAAAGAAAVAWFAVPHLSLLLVEANPYSFYRSPTHFAASSIVQGAALYPAHCAACHGAEGHGDGPLAKSLPVPPADLTAGHLWMHSDGDLFAWLTNGIDAPRGGKAMPGFAATLSEDERWALIDYIHAHNAGVAMHGGTWPMPVAAPVFQTSCAGVSRRLDALQGRPVRLILGGTAPIGPQPGMTTILAASPAAQGTDQPGVCTAADPSLVQALAIVTGMAAEPPGSEFLIDADGWLRAMQAPGAPHPWSDPANLSAAIMDMRMHKLAPRGTAPMAMPMNMPM